MSYHVATNDGRVAWIFVGHKLLGPCYQCGDDGKWCNIYSHGNFGKNFSEGGTFSGDPGKNKYNSLAECVSGRSKEIEKAKASCADAHKLFLQFAAVPAIGPVLMDDKKTHNRDAKGRFKK